MLVSVCASLSMSQVESPPPPLWEHLRSPQVWRPVSTHLTPCQWLMPSTVGALMVLSIPGWSLRYVPGSLSVLLGGAWRPWLGRAHSGWVGCPRS